MGSGVGLGGAMFADLSRAVIGPGLRPSARRSPASALYDASENGDRLAFASANPCLSPFFAGRRAGTLQAIRESETGIFPLTRKAACPGFPPG